MIATLLRLMNGAGNSFSNAIYFFGSLCVMQSATRSNTTRAAADFCSHEGRGFRQGNLFWAADYCFGVMLLLLAGTSFVWVNIQTLKAA